MEKTYETSDFYTTAVLMYRGFEVLQVTTHDSSGRESPKGRVKHFHFEDTPELQDVIMSYINGKLEGNIRDFRNAIESVKDMVHSG